MDAALAWIHCWRGSHRPTVRSLRPWGRSSVRHDRVASKQPQLFGGFVSIAYPTHNPFHHSTSALQFASEAACHAPLLQLDGPYAAPSQHYRDYPIAMVVSSGIGVTPATSVIDAVVRHRCGVQELPSLPTRNLVTRLVFSWKQGLNPGKLFFYWICRHDQVDSFHWVVSKLRDIMAELAVARSTDQQRVSAAPQYVRHQGNYSHGRFQPDQHVEVHIYVTGYDHQTHPRQPPARRNSISSVKPFSLSEVFGEVSKPSARSMDQVGLVAHARQGVS